jgi:hypothetical protein
MRLSFISVLLDQLLGVTTGTCAGTDKPLTVPVSLLLLLLSPPPLLHPANRPINTQSAKNGNLFMKILPFSLLNRPTP